MPSVPRKAFEYSCVMCARHLPLLSFLCPSQSVEACVRRHWDDEEQALTGHNGWARDLFYLVVFSQDTYCGGYSGEDPPLPIPNREVKLAIADGTAPPGGRVGSCHFLIRVPDIERCRGLLRIRNRQRVQPPVLTSFGQPRGAPRPCPGRSLCDFEQPVWQLTC